VVEDICEKINEMNATKKTRKQWMRTVSRSDERGGTNGWLLSIAGGCSSGFLTNKKRDLVKRSLDELV
jgi:hypothetical protein